MSTPLHSPPLHHRSLRFQTSWFGLGGSDKDTKSPASFTPLSKPKKISEEKEIEAQLERERRKNNVLKQKIAEFEQAQSK